jgi:hypothetical protein
MEQKAGMSSGKVDVMAKRKFSAFARNKTLILCYPA